MAKKNFFARKVDFQSSLSAKISTLPKSVGIEPYRSEIVPRAQERCFWGLGTLGWAFQLDFWALGAENSEIEEGRKSCFFGGEILIGFFSRWKVPRSFGVVCMALGTPFGSTRLGLIPLSDPNNIY